MGRAEPGIVMPSPDKSQMSTWVDDDLRAVIENVAKQEGRSVSSLLRRAAEAYVGQARFTVTQTAPPWEPPHAA